MAATDDDALIARLSGTDPLAVASVVRDCVRRIRDGAWTNDHLLTILETIAALATHESARVRQDSLAAASQADLHVARGDERVLRPDHRRPEALS